jgi:hypothetical protein
MLFKLILILGFAQGGVADVNIGNMATGSGQWAFSTEEACKAVGDAWIERANGTASYVCLPFPQRSAKGDRVQ